MSEQKKQIDYAVICVSEFAERKAIRLLKKVGVIGE